MEQELKEILISMQSELKAMKEAQEQTNVRLDKVDARLDKVDARLDKVDCRLDAIEGRLDVIEEDTQVTREAVNTLLEWAEKAQVEVKIPLLKKAE